MTVQLVIFATWSQEITWSANANKKKLEMIASIENEEYENLLLKKVSNSENQQYKLKHTKPTYQLRESVQQLNINKLAY